MKKGLYSVLDKKVNVYGTPFAAQNDVVALRSFQRFATDPSYDACMFPQDFELYRIAQFDEDSGNIESFSPEFLAKAAQFQITATPENV